MLRAKDGISFTLGDFIITVNYERTRIIGMGQKETTRTKEHYQRMLKYE